MLGRSACCIPLNFSALLAHYPEELLTPHVLAAAVLVLIFATTEGPQGSQAQYRHKLNFYKPDRSFMVARVRATTRPQKRPPAAKIAEERYEIIRLVEGMD